MTQEHPNAVAYRKTADANTWDAIFTE